VDKTATLTFPLVSDLTNGFVVIQITTLPAGWHPAVAQHFAVEVIDNTYAFGTLTIAADGSILVSSSANPSQAFGTGGPGVLAGWISMTATFVTS
jgi:hypothetical protein